MLVDLKSEKTDCEIEESSELEDEAKFCDIEGVYDEDFDEDEENDEEEEEEIQSDEIDRTSFEIVPNNDDEDEGENEAEDFDEYEDDEDEDEDEVSYPAKKYNKPSLLSIKFPPPKLSKRISNNLDDKRKYTVITTRGNKEHMAGGNILNSLSKFQQQLVIYSPAIVLESFEFV